jgi:hypothetical protein
MDDRLDILAILDEDSSVRVVDAVIIEFFAKST